MGEILSKIRCSILAYIWGAIHLLAGVGIVTELFELYKWNVVTHTKWFVIFEIIILYILVVSLSFLYWLNPTKEEKENRKISIMEFRNKVATQPRKNNYRWQGGFSFITYIVLKVVAFIRTTSCLQLCKAFYRLLAKASKDIDSKRPNVPPAFQEFYFLLWGIFFLAQHLFGVHNDLICGINIYFIVESFVWILFYAVFRRFFEERYAIYHVLEHLPTIFLIIPMQAFAYAQISEEKFRDVLLALMGQATIDNHFLLTFVGFLYTAIVIGMIISTFPSENVKRSYPPTVILGAGDLVKNRLLPAVVKCYNTFPHSRKADIRVYTKEGKKCSQGGSLDVNEILERANPIFELIKDKGSSDKLAWICTPSDTHLYYTDMLREQASFMAVEKPIASNQSDLERFKVYINSEARIHTFFLSYYVLEKALPLTFLARPNSFYLNYLDKNIEEFYQKYLDAGKLEKITVIINEKSDNRDLPEGGQWIETFLHNCLIASMFAGLPSEWNITRFNFDKSNQNYITLGATSKKGVEISLKLEKGAKEKLQFAKLVFENGIIEADFDQRNAVFYKNESKEEFVKVGLAKAFTQPYDVQCHMVYECYVNKKDPSNIDGLFNQMEVLEWMLEKYEEYK